MPDSDLRNCIGVDRFAAHVGIELLEVQPGQATARLKIENHHLNGLGRTQGGAVFTLADLAFAAASNSHGIAAMAISVNIFFVKATSAGSVLTARAMEISRNAKLATYQVDVTSETGERVASFQGMVYRKTPAPSLITK
ncbi:MAG: hotdog fold thioesterase [Desulfatirhabdiaceae bacterium]